MNSMDRVMNVVQGKPVDRAPMTLMLSLYGARLISCSLNEYYTNGAIYAEGQVAVKEQCEPDIIFTPFFLASEGQAFGSQVAFFEKNPPNLKKPAVTPEKIHHLKKPDINSHSTLVYIREATRLLAAKLKQETPLAGIVVSPVDLPAMILGIEAWLEMLLFDREKSKKILELTTEFFVEWGNTILADGANVLFMPAAFCNPAIVIRKIIEEITVPVCKQAFAQIKGPIVMHPGGSVMAKFLDLYTELPNVIGFVLDTKDDFSQARAIAGPEKVLFGNLNGPNLDKFKPEQIKKSCEKILEDRKEDSHFVLASSRADIPYDTPLENIKIIRNAVEIFQKV